MAAAEVEPVPDLTRAVATLSAREPGPDDGAAATAVAERLDLRYLAIDSDDESRAAVFRQARAAAAVAAVYNLDPSEAAIEAAYECLHALDHDADERLVKLVANTN
jgi:hypothetical protein